jgi:S-formylglutathione hydrolase FrmB
VLSLLAVAVTGGYLALTATLLAPIDTHGAKVDRLTLRSRATAGEEEVAVVVPAGMGSQKKRPLLLFLHGKGESPATYEGDEAMLSALAALGSRAPILAFPSDDGGSYWHDRESGAWGSYVMDEVIPTVLRRFPVDPDRIAVGGISMGGFGAYDLALAHPGRFCAVGGHSSALWLDGGDTAPGAFDDAEDFERHDVVEALEENPQAFGEIPIWNDAGSEDPFLVSNMRLREILEDGDADLTAHTWRGDHSRAYWDRHWDAYLGFYARALADCD